MSEESPARSSRYEADAIPLYTLLVTSGRDAGLAHQIRARRVSVGTSDDNELVLSDPSVRPRHFVVVFEEGGWKAITFEPSASILIDRRWQHPRTRERGARIFVGESELLLFAGQVDLATAESGAEGLDMDAETLRDDALTQVGDQAYRFRHDMMGKAEPVSDRKNDRKPAPRRPGETPRGTYDREWATTETRGNAELPDGVLPADGSKLFTAKPGMMRRPEDVDRARRPEPAAPVTPPPPRSEPPKSDGPRSDPRVAKNAWGSNLPAIPENRAIAKPQTISLTETAISAMPSSSRDLVVLYDRDGAFASNVRILATRIEELKTRLGYKSFLVTSVDEGDGKTVLSNNLALAMSEDSERKVALVDANFRSPRAGELFNLDPSRGLLAALAGERPLSQCVARVLGRNLIVLHAGGEHKNPASVLSSAKFKALLAELYQAVDFMIVDAPRAIPFADVPLLVQHVDAVIVVVSRDSTRRHELDLALETIGKSRIAGTVFVDKPPVKRPKRSAAKKTTAAKKA